MSVSEMLLPEFDQETAGTRKLLERFPEDKMGFKPHEKSMPLGRLVSHLAEIPSWAVNALTQDSLDLAPPGSEGWKPTIFESRQEVLETFDANVEAARAALADTPDEAFGETWSLLRGGETLISMPRIGVVRGMVLNHMIHHRAQLGVYLRLNDVPVPGVYGPSADEPAF